MPKKKTTLLSALDGGHLDGSLFGRVLSKVQNGEQDSEQTQISDRKRRGWRLKSLAKSRKSDGR